jgi:hypothetical protein
VLAQLHQRGGVGELARRLRKHDLAAVRGRGDPCGAVHVEADEAVLRPLRFAGVDPDPDAKLPRGSQCSLRLDGCGDGLRRALEDDEEGISLRVDLDAAEAFEGRPQQAAVSRKSLGVPLAELLQQPRRAGDVGEEEGDRAGRQLTHD